MIIGGVAASVLGRPRLTQDVDALAILAESDCAEAVRVAAQYNIVPRIDDVLRFAERTRVNVLRSPAFMPRLSRICLGILKLRYKPSRVFKRERVACKVARGTVPSFSELRALQSMVRK